MRSRSCSASAFLSLTLLASGALAADLGGYGAPPPAPSLTRFDFTGRYAGIQAGYSRFGNDVSSIWGSVGGPTERFTYNADGAIGGVHLGANWQERNWLFGIETDFEAAGIAGTGKGDYGALHETSINWLGSLRGRLGLVSGSTLFYVTGGMAYGNVHVEQLTPTSLGPYSSGDEWKIGWTAGGGIEHAISSRVSLKLEYRYTDLGQMSVYNPTLMMKEVNDLTSHAVRAGMSFKF